MSTIVEERQWTVLSQERSFFNFLPSPIQLHQINTKMPSINTILYFLVTICWLPLSVSATPSPTGIPRDELITHEMDLLGFPKELSQLLISYVDYNKQAISTMFTQDMPFETVGCESFMYKTPIVPVPSHTLIQLGTFDELRGPEQEWKLPELFFHVTLPTGCTMTEDQRAAIGIQFWNQPLGAMDRSTVIIKVIDNNTYRLSLNPHPLVAPKDSVFELILPYLPGCTQSYGVSAEYFYRNWRGASLTNKPKTIPFGNPLGVPFNMPMEVVPCPEFNLQNLETYSPFQEELSFKSKNDEGAKVLTFYEKEIEYPPTTTTSKDDMGGKMYLGSTEELLEDKDVDALDVSIEVSIGGGSAYIEQVFRVRVLAYSIDNEQHMELEDWSVSTGFDVWSVNSVRIQKTIKPSLSKNYNYWLILPPLVQDKSYTIKVKQRLTLSHQPEEEDLQGTIQWRTTKEQEKEETKEE